MRGEVRELKWMSLGAQRTNHVGSYRRLASAE